MKNRLLIIASILLCVFGVVSTLVILRARRISSYQFQAPGADYPSSKKVSQYYVETMRVEPEEAARMSRNGVDFRVSKDATLKGIISNLIYYGLVRDEESLKYTLEQTKDTTPGLANAIQVGAAGSIDVESSYLLSVDMTAWEVADVLLNQPIHWGSSERYEYLFMPGDPNAPRGSRPNL